MKLDEIKIATCCENGSHYIQNREAGPSPEGPEKTGWSMSVGAYEEAYNDVYENVRFCPFCGKKLPQEES